MALIYYEKANFWRNEKSYEFFLAIVYFLKPELFDSFKNGVALIIFVEWAFSNV